jgi:hypothetical protein
MGFKLVDEFPALTEELATLLTKVGEMELSRTVPGLKIVERCRCGDDFCATMYTVRPPPDEWSRNQKNVALNPKTGLLILDVLDQEITGIEVLFRDEIRKRLLRLLP